MNAPGNGYALRTDGLTRDFTTLRAVDRLSIEVPSGIAFSMAGGVKATLVLLAIVLTLLDAALLSAGLMRFQRARLLLD